MFSKLSRKKGQLQQLYGKGLVIGIILSFMLFTEGYAELVSETPDGTELVPGGDPINLKVKNDENEPVSTPGTTDWSIISGTTPEELSTVDNGDFPVVDKSSIKLIATANIAPGEYEIKCIEDTGREVTITITVTNPFTVHELQKVTIANQGILPNSAPTAVIGMNLVDVTGGRKVNDLTITVKEGEGDPESDGKFKLSDIEQVRIYAATKGGIFSYDAGAAPVALASKSLDGSRQCKFVTADNILIPADDKDNNAGNDFYITIETSATIAHKAYFTVECVYVYDSETTGKITTDTIKCEANIRNMALPTGYHGSGIIFTHPYSVDGVPYTKPEVYPMDYPYQIFGLNIAGSSGCVNSSGVIKDVLNKFLIQFSETDNTGLFLSHILDPWPNISIWEDTNNNGIFDPIHEGGADILLGPFIGDTDAIRHTWGAMTDLKVTLEAVADNKVDFFICQATDPDHAWVTNTPKYGDKYKASINWDTGIDFDYSVQDNATGISLETDYLHSCMQIDTQVLDPPEADGMPAPLFSFNLADSPKNADNETVEWIKIYFKGTESNGFKPTDLAPLSDDKYSGICLWEDSKEKIGEAWDTDHTGLFDPRQGYGFIGEGVGGFTDKHIPLSTDSLVWYNSDNTLWTPENDDPGHAGTGADPKIYYVKLRPKTAWQIPPNDKQWNVTRRDDNGVELPLEPPAMGDDENTIWRGYDLHVTIRGNGVSNADYSNNPSERGLDLNDEIEAYMDSPDNIMFGIRGHNASNDVFPVDVVTPKATLPTFYSDLTRQEDGNTISLFKKTAAIGINMVAPLGSTINLRSFVVFISDTGEKNFAITDLINPYLIHPQENNPDSGCGLAIYRDNPDAGTNGSFDEHDIRVEMSAVPYPSSTGNVKASRLQYVIPLVDDKAPIPTTDIGANEGDDYFLVVQPTSAMDPGDDFQLWVYNSWFEEDGAHYAGRLADNSIIDSSNSEYRVRGKRVQTATITNYIVNNAVLANQFPVGKILFPDSAATSAIGINVNDPSGKETLNGLRLYFTPQTELDPASLLAALDGTENGGVSIWRGDVHLPTAGGTWTSDWNGNYVHGTGEQTPLKVATELNWFKDEKVCWADKDQSGRWSDGDVLWINSVDPKTQTIITYDHGTDTAIVADEDDNGSAGVALNQGIWGFSFYDENKDGDYDKGEDLYYLGRGRKVLGYFYDVDLVTPNNLPTVLDDNIDYYVKFKTSDSVNNYGQHKFTFHMENSGIKYSEHHSFANKNLTCSTITLKVEPTSISNLTATRKEGYMLLSWDRPEGDSYYSTMITRCKKTDASPNPPGASEKPTEGVSYSVGDSVGRSKVVFIGSADSFMDLDVVLNSSYYYQAFAGDGNDMINANPFPVTFVNDTTPPMPVIDYDETRKATQVDITWDHEDINDLAGILVLRREDDASAGSPTDGQTYIAGNTIKGSKVIANITSAQSSLATAYTAGGTTLTLADAQKFVDPNNAFIAYVNVGAELVGYTNVDANTLTLSAVSSNSFSAGTVVTADLKHFVDTQLPLGYPHYALHPYDSALNYAAAAPHIKLLTPVGYESLASGMTHVIKWNNFGHVDGTVGIDLYKNDQWLMEISGSSDNSAMENSYSWDIPTSLELDNDYKIRIISNQNASISDISANNFEISSATISAEIKSYKPNYYWGESIVCQWTSNIGGSVNIELYNNGTLVKKVNDSAIDNNVAIKTYPLVLGPDLEASNNYSLKVISAENNSLSAVTQSFAVLKGAYILLQSPEDKEQITVSDSYNIKWKSNAGGKVDIYYSASSGSDASWVKVKLDQSNVTTTDDEVLSYAWDVSSLASGINYRVKMISTTDYSLVAQNLEDFSISRTASISLTPDSIEIKVAEGETESASAKLKNNNPETIQYTIATNTDSGGSWLSATASNMTLAAGQEGTITLKANANGLALGDYTGSLTVSAGSSSKTVPVSLAVMGHELSVSIDSISMKADTDQTSDEQQFQLWNSGVGTMTYTVSSPDSWVVLSGDVTGSSTAGTEGVKKTIGVVCNSTGLTPGVHNSTITVQDTENANIKKDISVEFIVAVPNVNVSTETLTAVLKEGDSAPASSFEVWNSGFGTLNYAVSYEYPEGAANSSWIKSVTPMQGQVSTGEENKATVKIEYDLTDLAEGQYTAVLTVRDSAIASVAAKTINVTMSYTKLLTDSNLLIKLTGNNVTKQLGDRISFWQDQSGNNNDASQINKNKQPEYQAAAIQTQSGIQFNAKQAMDINNLSSVATHASRTIALVFKTGLDITKGQVLFAQGDKTQGVNVYIENQTLYANAWNFLTGSWNAGIEVDVSAGEGYYLILVLDSENGTISGHINGNAIAPASGVGNDFASSQCKISMGNYCKSTYTSYKTKLKGFVGTICEMLYYDTVLNAEQVTNTKSYLNNKYRFDKTQIEIRKTDLVLWLRSDVGNKKDRGLVKEWINKNDGTKKAACLKQGAKTKRPMMVEDSINGLPVIRFDGLSSCLMAKNNAAVNSDKLGFAAKTVIITLTTGNDISSRQMIWSQGNKKVGLNTYIEDGKVYMGAWDMKAGWIQFVSGGTLVENTSYCIRFVFDSSNDLVQGYINGKIFGQESDIGRLTKHSAGAMGAVKKDSVVSDGTVVRKGAYLAADIAEFLMYNAILTNDDIKEIQDYMTARYNISFSE